MRTIFDRHSDSYAKYYSLTEHLIVYEIIVFFKDGVIFKQYIPKKHKQFGIKLYQMWDSEGYTDIMTMYIGKDKKCATPTMTAKHATVRGLAARIEHFGHQLYVGNSFSSPALFDDLHTKTVYCCGTVRPNRKGMPKNFGHKMKMKRVYLKTKVKSNLTAIEWKDKRNVNILTNMHSPPLEGNFCDE
jgi:hypothetical protein